jgi:sigma-B regulation protein RsbU (phosphoserine phosphatase)
MTPSEPDMPFVDLIPDFRDRIQVYATDAAVTDPEIQELFKQELDRAIRELNKAVASCDEEKVRKEAHSLQGMGGSVGAPEISLAGEEFSRAAKEGDYPFCLRLLHAIEDWRAFRHPPDKAATPLLTEAPTLHGRILVVDDEEPNRKFLESLLRERGAEVLLAEDGETALDMVRTHRPDVALVDVMMPGIEGYEVCERIRKNPDLNQTSVIMVTARSTAQDVAHAFGKGAFDYIRKPFHSRELLARVHNALVLKRNTDALESWKNRVSKELEVAGTLQARLFDPSPIFSQRLDAQAAYQPSEHIGGDVFDVQLRPDGSLIGYVADVAGHGVSSALISTLLKGLVTEILQAPGKPELYEIANELERRFRQCVPDPELYATAIFVRVEPETDSVMSLSCGHHAPLVLSLDGSQPIGDIPERGGMPIGLFPSGMGDPFQKEDEVTFSLPDGCSLLLYTDGITEAQTKGGTECGREGLLSILSDPALHADPWQDPNRILATMETAGYQIHADDCSLLRISRVSRKALLCYGEAPPELESASSVAHLIAEALQKNEQWEDDAVSLVTLLVTEHLANCIRHGRLDPGSRIGYRLSRTVTDRILLLLTDQGIAWNREEAPRTPGGQEGKQKEYGRGLDLIDAICPLQRHFRRDGGNSSLYLLEPDAAPLPT